MGGERGVAASMSGTSKGSTPAGTDEPILERYLRITRESIERVRVAPPRRSFLVGAAEDFLGMARAYLADAESFRAKGDPDRALAAVSYAHGWLDAGVRLGLLDGGEDDVRFTLYR